MITDFFLKIITNFKNYIVNQRELSIFQREFQQLWTSSTLEVIEYSNKTNRGYFANDACQVAPFENKSQIKAGIKHEFGVQTGTQQDIAKELNILESKGSFNSSDHMSTITGNTRANYNTDDDSQDGGRMIRNKSSVRNHVTRKRQNKQSKQNKQNKQKRKTKRRITRRTTRKLRKQGKIRRTKKSN